jgi:hypothetical protein
MAPVELAGKRPRKGGVCHKLTVETIEIIDTIEIIETLETIETLEIIEIIDEAAKSAAIALTLARNLICKGTSVNYAGAQTDGQPAQQCRG